MNLCEKHNLQHLEIEQQVNPPDSPLWDETFGDCNEGQKVQLDKPQLPVDTLLYTLLVAEKE